MKQEIKKGFALLSPIIYKGKKLKMMTIKKEDSSVIIFASFGGLKKYMIDSKLIGDIVPVKISIDTKFLKTGKESLFSRKDK